MRHLLLLAAAFGLSGCGGEIGTAADLTPPATQMELDGSQQEYIACILDVAKRLDDESQRPIAFALRIIPMCEMEFANWVAVATSGGNRFFRYGIAEDLQRQKEDLVIRMVVRERLDRRFGP